MANKGTITGKQLITDEGVNRPLELKKNLQKAIDKTEELIKVASQFNTLSKNYKGATNEKEFLAIKEKDIALTKKAISIETERNKAKLSAQRIEAQILRNKKLALDLENKKQLAQRKSTKLTIEERVQNQANNKVLRNQARIKLGLADAYEKLNTKRNKAQRTLANLLSAEKQNTRAIKIAQKEYSRLDKRVKSVDRATKNYSKNIGNYKSAISGLTGTFRSLVSALGLMGGAMAFVGVMRNGIGIIRDFGSTMSTVAGIYRTSRKDLADLEQKIIDVSGASVTTATDVAKIAESLATLGKTKDEVSNLLEPVNNLSIGLKASASESAEFLVQTMNAFGASSDEAGKYADTIATIRTSTSLDFQKMRDSFQYLTPISKVLNKDLAYTGSLIGILADNGVKAQRAGRLLATAQQKLASNGSNLTLALQELNDAKDSGVKGDELLAVSSRLFGTEASALGIILASNSKEIDVNAQAIRNNSGALDDLVNEQLKSLDAHFKILKSRWEEYILNADKSSGASNKLKDAIKYLSDNLAEIVNGLVTAVKMFLLYKAAVIAYSIYTKAASVVTAIYTISIRAFKIGLKETILELKIFNSSVKAMELGGFALALGVVSSAFVLIRSSAINAALAIKKMNEYTLKGKETGASITKDITDRIEKEKQAISEKYVLEKLGITNAYKLNEVNKKQKNETIELIKTERKELLKKIASEELEKSTYNKNAPIFAEKSEIIKKRIKLYNSLGVEINKYSLEAKQKAIEEAKKAKQKAIEEAKKANKEANKAKQKAIEIDKKLNNDAYKLAKFRIEETIKLNKELANNEEANKLQRLQALQKVADEEENLALLNRNFKISQIQYASDAELEIIAKGGENAIALKKEIAKRERDARLLIEEQYQSEVKDINDKYAKGSDNLLLFNEDKFKNAQKSKLDLLSISENNEIEQLNNALAKKEITQEEHEKRMQGIKAKYAKKALEQQIEALKEVLDNEQLTTKQREDLAKHLSDLKVSLSEVEIQLSDSGAESSIVTLEKLKSKFDDYSGYVQDLGNAIYEGRIQRIDDEITRSEEYYARQLELAGNDQAQRQLIEDEARRKKLALEKKKRKEQRKQAIMNKAFAIAEVGINTAVAISKAVAESPLTGGLPFSAIAGAIGAIQIATILAKPIPQYAKGTSNHKGGIALVGEERPEVISEPNKAPYIVSSPSLLDLPKGTQVAPSIEEYNRVLKASILSSIAINNGNFSKQKQDDILTKELLTEIKGLRNDAKNRKQIIHLPKVDIEHAVWKQQNIDW